MIFLTAMCKTLLDSTKVAEHGANLFCKQCHSRRYGPKGFSSLSYFLIQLSTFQLFTFSTGVGFGIGGTLTTDLGERFGNHWNEMGFIL